MSEQSDLLGVRYEGKVRDARTRHEEVLDGYRRACAEDQETMALPIRAVPVEHRKCISEQKAENNKQQSSEHARIT